MLGIAALIIFVFIYFLKIRHTEKPAEAPRITELNADFLESDSEVDNNEKLEDAVSDGINNAPIIDNNVQIPLEKPPLTAAYFIEQLNKGEYILISELSDEVLNEIIINHGELLTLKHMGYGNGYVSNNEFAHIHRKLYNVIGCNEEHIKRLPIKVLVEYLAYLAENNLEDYAKALAFVSEDLHRDIAEALVETFTTVHGAWFNRGGTRVALTDKMLKRRRGLCFLPADLCADVISEKWDYDHYESPSQFPTELINKKCINALIFIDINLARKFGQCYPLDDVSILMLLEIDLGFYGTLNLTQISQETGEKIIKMSKSGFVLESLPRRILENNKELVADFILADMKRLKNIENEKLRNDIMV